MVRVTDELMSWPSEQVGIADRRNRTKDVRSIKFHTRYETEGVHRNQRKNNTIGSLGPLAFR